MPANTPRIDRLTFSASVALMLAVCIPLAIDPEAGGEFINRIYQAIASTFGVVYQWATIAMTGFLMWIAFGRYGSRRLGGDEERPEFSTYSWVAMLFCAGVGGGLMYWSTIEWAFYVDTPPFGVEPGSNEAIEWAASYGIFHWGFSAWCLYCFPAVAIAYPYYRRRLPHLRLSTGLHGLLGDAGQNGFWARLVDLIFIVALLGGAGTSLGLATPMIAAVTGELFGIESSFALELFIVFLCAVLFAISVYLGLDRGIRRLSDLNAGVALVLLGFVLVCGPTLFLLEMGTNALGLMLQNFVRMNTWTEPVGETGFVKDWTVFYWAWWLAYGPFMGIFVTRISRGRTLRGLILGMTILGTLGCAIFYVVLGNFALHLDLQGAAPLRELVADGRAAEAIAQVYGALPLRPFGLAAFGLVALIFAATTYDSGSYTLAAAATRTLPAGTDPARWHRVFWAFALGVLPGTLMLVGGLRAIQSAVLVVSLPVMVVCIGLGISLVRSLRADDS
jgi:BCCT family betaine/carnitine transporter